MFYSAQVEGRFRDPRHAGPPPAGEVLVGRADSPGSAAVLQISLRVAGGKIQQATFQALGCPSCIAAGDWACEWLTGRALAQVGELKAAIIESALELAPDKRHCALMVEDALAQATAGNSRQTQLSQG